MPLSPTNLTGTLRKLLTILCTAAILALAGWGALVTLRPVHSGPPSALRYPIRGIDISAHNGQIDFDAVKNDGISFVIIKMTEGGDFKDPRFIDNIRRAQLAGLKTGVYHFFRFDTDGVAQGINIIHSLRGRLTDMPVVIDLEEWTNPTHISDEDVIARLEELLGYLDSHGLRTMIYTNKDGYHRYINHRFNNIPLWICSFTGIDPDLRWTLWQYTHSGKVDGIENPVDINVWNGDSTMWLSWCGDGHFLTQ